MQGFQRKTVLFSPGTWISAIALTGCGLIALLVSIVAQSQIHTQIVMRRAWFNHSLRHYDLAYHDLNSVRPRMMDNSLWQSRMYEVLQARKDWRRLGLTALQLHEREAATPEWIWNGWKALLRVGWSSKADELFRILNEPHLLGQIGSGRAELVKAYDLHLAGKHQESIDSIRRAREFGVEPSLVACLESEWLIALGRWKEADVLISKIPIDTQEGLARRWISDAAILLTKGQAVAALGMLDVYLLEKGVASAQTDRFLRGAALKAPSPYCAWATQTLKVWQRDRSLEGITSETMPNWNLAAYPQLPEGKTLARITPGSLTRVDGNPLAPGKPLVAYESFQRIHVSESGDYTLVLRGAVNRHENRGEIVIIQIPGQKAGATYFGSRMPTERRFAVHLSEGPTSLTLGSVPVRESNRSGSGFWLHELILIKRTTPPLPEDTGLRDFLLYDWDEWLAQQKADAVITVSSKK